MPRPFLSQVICRLVHSRTIRFSGLASSLFMVFLSTAAVPAQAQTFQVLYSFTGGNDGGQPYGQPYVDKKGNVFGTTTSAGPNVAGTLWEVPAGGALEVLHGFSGADGRAPFSNLAVNSAGTMFGATYNGGIDSNGTVFSIDGNGNYSDLYNFVGEPNDGANSYGGAVLDQSGNLYGMTTYGGTGNIGTVWTVTASGTESLLHSFTGGNDGDRPFYGNPYRDKHGNLFGTTNFGGGSCDCGTLFEVDNTGSFKVLHTFSGGNDGANPIGTVLRDKHYIYGTAGGGGPNRDGTIWRYDLDSGKLKTLYSFTSADGNFPTGGVACQLVNPKKAAPACVPGQNGNTQPVLYGTTPEGGANGVGTIWELDSSGAFHKLYDFGHFNGIVYLDGSDPMSPPFIDAKGNLYGTASTGGPDNSGTVWKFTP